MEIPFNQVPKEDGIRFELSNEINMLSGEAVELLSKLMRPVGSLGRLEEIAARLASIQGTLRPTIIEPYVVVFAGDHGITASHPEISALSREVTLQIMCEYAQGRAVVNVLANVAGASIALVDAGVAGEVGDDDLVINLKMRPGTHSFASGPAMTHEEVKECFVRGALVIGRLVSAGVNLIALGDIGIGNTSSASLLMHRLTKLQVDQCVGRGTGVADSALRKKHALLRSIAADVPEGDLMHNLAYFGGFEIAMLVGAMHECVRRGVAFIVDGFIVTVAYGYANALVPETKKYAFFGHCSDEFGHNGLLEYLGVRPLLHLDMRLGEGSGAVMAIPIIKAAASLLFEISEVYLDRN